MEEASGDCFSLFFQFLKETGGYRERSAVYSDGLVMWLSAYQRLQEGASIARALEEFKYARLWELAGDCKRTRERRVSPNTGGYAQARQKLKLSTVELACDELFEWLTNGSHAESGKEKRLYSIDGSSIELSYTKKLSKKYPTDKKGHYPLLRILVCHDLESGLAVRPEYGAMYGKNTEGEIQLFKKMVKRLPQESTLVGDRNFGIFAVAYHAQREGHDVILRLMESRAKKVLGKVATEGTDQEVLWHVSPQEIQRNNPELPQDAIVKGRVICRDVKSYRGDKTTRLILFTTSKESAETIIQNYGERWKIEIDLRTLKQTVNMHMLHVKSEDMAHKELLLGIAAYNLVRTVIRSAAKNLGVRPRDLSFKRILYSVNSTAKAFAATADPLTKTRLLERLQWTFAVAKHPKRKRLRSEPRAIVRRRRQKYPSLKTSRAKARQELIGKN
jgi:hypothetical protein